MFKDFLGMATMSLYSLSKLEAVEYTLVMWYISHMEGKIRRSEILSAEDFEAANNEFIEIMLNTEF